MDVVALGLAKADASRKYAPVRRLRRRDLRGPAALPTVIASPATVTPATFAAGTQISGSAIASAVHVLPDFPGAFTYTGTRPSAGPAVGGSLRSLTSAGIYTNTSPSPFEVETILDTAGGAFDIIGRDATAEMARLVIDGQAMTALATLMPAGNTATPVRFPVTGLAAGRHRVRLEFSAYNNFCGFVIGPNDGLRAVPPPGLRCLVIGDSFTEPTVVDSTTGSFTRGWVSWFGAMAGVDAWACGSGGTGYLNPGPGGRVKFRDRLAADVIPNAPDIIIWAGGSNDYSLYSAAAIGTEAAACYAQIAAALPNCQQIVLSPFWPRGHMTIPPLMFAARDAIKAAALAAGLLYLDIMQPPLALTAQPSGVSTASTAISAQTISSSVSFRVGTVIQIDTGANTEVRSVQSVTGSGPYTLNVNDIGNALSVAHASGIPIVECGENMNTGVGWQGTPAGGGTSPRYTGNDATHPTWYGHFNIAHVVYEQLARALPA
jgi:lysophospholipase L1-like esterase